MLDVAMKVITYQLNRYMQQRFDLDEDVVVLSTPFDSEGAVATHANNKLVVFLVNLSKDTIPCANNRYVSASGGASSFVPSQPLYLNLHVVIASCFDAIRYTESLKYLSCAVSCFQQSSVIDRDTHPELSDGVDKLILDIENIGIHELSNLWGILGGKYLPSILYKVRMVTFVSDDIRSRDMSAATPQTSVVS